MSFYTVAVKGFLFWKKYCVVSHSFDATLAGGKIEPWLCLKTVDNFFVYVPRIDSKRWLVYPDYSDFVAKKEKLQKKKALKEMTTNGYSVSAEDASQANPN